MSVHNTGERDVAATGAVRSNAATAAGLVGILFV
jgi:hypothetical protein